MKYSRIALLGCLLLSVSVYIFSQGADTISPELALTDKKTFMKLFLLLGSLFFFLKLAIMRIIVPAASILKIFLATICMNVASVFFAISLAFVEGNYIIEPTIKFFRYYPNVFVLISDLLLIAVTVAAETTVACLFFKRLEKRALVVWLTTANTLVAFIFTRLPILDYILVRLIGR